MDEICLGTKQKILAVASNVETGEPLCIGQDRKEENPILAGVEAVPYEKEKQRRSTVKRSFG